MHDTGAPASPTPAPLTGQSLLRDEDDELLRGAARFHDDLAAAEDPHGHGLTHATFVRSPFPHATVTGFDASEALAAPGVVAVIGPDDAHELVVGAIAPGPQFGPPQPALTHEVRYAGQVVGLVVAETAALAADAAEMVIVDYDEHEPVLDLDTALQSTRVEATDLPVERAADRFDDADGRVVVRETFWNPRQMPAPIETIGLTAWWDDGHLHVWAATQRPHGARTSLAKQFDMPEDRIHVRTPAVGGGFGGKVSRTPEELLIPFAAKRVGRPVKWQQTRTEYFLGATQARGEQVELELAGTTDGRITALRATMVKDGGGYPLVGVVLPNAYSKFCANGCYDIAHVEFGSVGVLTNRPPTSAFRGAGRSGQISALERAVDMFAARVDMDPAEVRRINLIVPDAMPYETPTGATYDEADYPGDLERALAAAGYDDLRAEQAQRRAGGDPVVMGIGIASYLHMTTGGGGEEASVTINADGSVTIVTGSTTQGHSHAVTWAQLAADVLKVPIEAIEVVEGDTDRIATGQGAIGSRSLQTAGLAIHNSSTELVERARQTAAALLEASPDDIVLSDEIGRGFHVVGTPARTVTWADLAAAEPAQPEYDLSCGEFYDTQGRNTFPSGCHIAVVEVDTETGRTKIVRHIAVDDAGPRVNPMVVEGQVHGGIASGAAQVLGETVLYDDAGNPVTTNFADYAIGSADQFPSFEVVESASPSSMNVLGVKGIGESGTVGATPAVHNAIVDAVSHLGVEHIDLPCTPERVWRAIQAARHAD